MVSLHSPPPATVAEPDLITALSHTWSTGADRVRYLPEGGGSYHWIAEINGVPVAFVTVDDLDTKPWIATERDATFAGLEIAYEAAANLQHVGGLDFVVGPRRSPEGSLISRLSHQYAMAVFPFVDGEPGHWGDPISGASRRSLLEQLAMLHAAHPRGGTLVPRRPLTLPEQPLLDSVLDSLDHPWDDGPFAEPARQVLVRHAADVAARLVEFHDLARRIGDPGDGAVLTHGEPHPGNILHSSAGPRLIDWDTVALAWPERDLWMLHDDTPDVFAPYEALTGRRVDNAAISFYRLAWTLSDIASLAALFRAAHEETDWVRTMWDVFPQLLRGGYSAPYGRV